MENFIKLFEEASQVGDKRKKVFNDLKTIVKSTILPKFAKALDKMEYSKVYFDVRKPVIVDHTPHNANEYEEGFAFTIEVIEGVGYFSECICGYNYTYDDSNFDNIKFEELNLSSVGIINFLDQLNFRMKNLIEAREKENETANDLVN
jgi:hypothetical protein